MEAYVQWNIVDTIWLRLISWHQRVRSRTQKITEYRYASFFLLNAFPENTFFRHQCLVHHRTAIVRYVNKKRRKHVTRKGARDREQQSPAPAASSQYSPNRLARPSRLRMPARTQFSIMVAPKSPPGLPFAAFTVTAANPIAMSIFTYLFHRALGIVPLEVYCMLLIGDKPNTRLCSVL